MENLDVSVDPTQPRADFNDFGLPTTVVRALARAGIKSPTPVQLAVIPDATAGRDVLGKAATGSGKTLAFGLPILSRLTGTRSKPKQPRALIIVPTRELAGQVRSSLEPFADAAGLKVATVYGGTPYDRQIKRLRAGADIVVATPGRLDDLVKRNAVSLDRVEVTVLDEADHLCDLGFFPAVSALVSMTPDGSQRMLLSATLDGDVDKLVRMHLVNPVTHDCDPESSRPDLHHHVLVSEFRDKVESAVSLLRANPRSIVFTRTRHGATNLAQALTERGIAAVDLHGSLTQNARERNLRKFKTGQADVVVATDVAARGIHVDGVAVVVHYDAPTEAKAFTHRSGRTARAGASGAVVTMTTPNAVGTVGRLHKAAGVTARHHNVQTAPSPMTVAALAESGSTTAPASTGGGGGGQGRTYARTSRPAGRSGSRTSSGSKYRGGSDSGSRGSSGSSGYRGRSDREWEPRSSGGSDSSSRGSSGSSYRGNSSGSGSSYRGGSDSASRTSGSGSSYRGGSDSASRPSGSGSSYRGGSDSASRPSGSGSSYRGRPEREWEPRTRGPNSTQRPTTGKPGAGTGQPKARWTAAEKREHARAKAARSR